MQHFSVLAKPKLTEGWTQTLNKTHYTGYTTLQYKKVAVKLCDPDPSLVLLHLWKVSKQSSWVSASVWSVTKVAHRSRKLSNKGLHWSDGACGGPGTLRRRWGRAVSDFSLQLIHSFLQLGTFGQEILVALVNWFLDLERKKKKIMACQNRLFSHTQVRRGELQHTWGLIRGFQRM